MEDLIHIMHNITMLPGSLTPTSNIIDHLGGASSYHLAFFISGKYADLTYVSMQKSIQHRVSNDPVPPVISKVFR